MRLVRGAYTAATMPRYTPYRPVVTHPIPELRAIPDGQGGWVARDTLTTERVGGEWHWILRPNVPRRNLTGSAGEAWIQWPGSPGGQTIAYRALGFPSGHQRCMCNILPYSSTVWSGDVIGILCNYGYNQIAVRVPVAQYPTAASWAAMLTARYTANDPVYVDWVAVNPLSVDLGPVDPPLPTYYPYTRVLVEGDYPPEVTARARVVDA